MTTPSVSISGTVTEQAAPTTDEPAESLERPLTTADRCDACGAQAFVRVVLAAGELLFCGHHGRAHHRALEDKALFIQDETSRLPRG